MTYIQLKAWIEGYNAALRDRDAVHPAIQKACDAQIKAWFKRRASKPKTAA